MCGYQRPIKKTAALLLIGILAVLSLFQAVSAQNALAETKDEPLVVGCIDIDNFIVIKDGIAEGYGVEFLNEISKYTGWKYKYEFYNWDECLAKLESGDVDLLFPAEYNDERGEKFLYSKIECCIDYVALVADINNDQLFYEDYEAYSGLKVGMITDNYLNTPFEHFASEKGFTFEREYFTDSEKLNAALKQGTIDAAVTGNLVSRKNTKFLAKFDFMPTYFIMNKADGERMALLDNALYRITLDNPYFSAELVNKFYGSDSTAVKSFTREENNYLKSGAVLRIVCDSNNFPFEWYDLDTQAYRGVNIDIMNRICELSGLQFEIIKTASLGESWSLIKSGGADIISGVYVDDVLASEYDITASSVYVNENYVAVGKSGTAYDAESKIKAAIGSSFVGLKEFVRKKYPDWEIVTYSTQKECLAAVEGGLADISIYSTMSLQSSTTLLDYPSLSTLSNITVALPISLGISNSTPNSALINLIINKAVSQITDTEIQQYVMSNTLMNQSTFSLVNIIRYRPWLFTSILAVLCVLVCSVVFVFFHAHERAKQAERMEAKNLQLEKANAAKNEFLARVSHDMRTPMNGILGIAELTDSMEMSDAARAAMVKLHSAGELLLGLINDTLDLSKIDSGKLVLNLKPVDFSEMASETLALARTNAANYGVTCTMRTSGLDGCCVNMDKPRTQQMLLNIITNAIKFSNRGGEVEISIECRPYGNEVRSKMVVTDHGIGIGKDFLPHLFEPFEQECRDEKRSGSGLGMAIVKKLADAMNGTVSVESEVGKGTTITLDIIYECCEKRVEGDSNPAIDFSSLSGRVVLLCEDNQLNTDVAVGLLKRVGCRVECAVNGEKGVEMFRASADGYYDAVLMDVQMPVMDGLAASKAIRAFSRADARHIPIIAMTANTFDDDIANVKRAGMNAHIAKPVNSRVMYDIIETEICEYREGQ